MNPKKRKQLANLAMPKQVNVQTVTETPVKVETKVVETPVVVEEVTVKTEEVVEETVVVEEVVPVKNKKTKK